MLVMKSRTPAIQPSPTSFSQINRPTQIEATPGTSNNESLKNESPDAYDNLQWSYLSKFSNLSNITLSQNNETNIVALM